MAGEHMANRLSLVVASRHGLPWGFSKIIVGWKSVIAVGYWKQLISSVPSIKPDHPYTVLPNRSLSEGQLPKLKALRAREYNCRARRERRDRKRVNPSGAQTEATLELQLIDSARCLSPKLN